MITVAYITSRKDNRFDWFFDGLCRQARTMPEVKIELLLIDYFKDERPIDLKNEAGIECRHILPMPSPWQGKHQLSSVPYFACANARNTAFVYCKYDYIAFCDDLTVLSSGWLNAAVEAVRLKYVALGSYQKAYDVEVKDGELDKCRVESSGKDPREYLCSAISKVQVKGDNLFGCSIVIPLDKALEINGFDCLTDSIGYEDQAFGKRLEKVGCRFFYDRRMFTTESEDHVNTNIIFKREDPMLGIEKYNEVLSRFGVTRSIYRESDNKDCSHIIVEVCNLPSPLSVWNFHSLSDLRNKVQAGVELTLEDMKYPERTWYNNKLISEL